MYKPVDFDRQHYLECEKEFESYSIEDVECELSEFNFDIQDIAFELAYTRYALAKLENKNGVENPSLDEEETCPECDS